MPLAKQDIKDETMAFIKKGKNLAHEMMKVIRFAHREGLSAWLRYVGDDIAETEAEAKVMR